MQTNIARTLAEAGMDLTEVERAIDAVTTGVHGMAFGSERFLELWLMGLCVVEWI